MIRGVMFDVGGVIVHERTSLYDSIAQASGLTLEQVRTIAAPMTHGAQRGEIGEAEYWSALSHAIGIQEGRLRGIETYCAVDQDVVRIIEGLARYRRCLLTNTTSFHPGYDFSSIFDIALRSYDLGMRKPEERIYHAAIHATGLFANEILFVDDQMRNIIPAQSIGMATHHFRNAEDLRRALREHSVEVDNGC